tara:strand:+ start:835 stop:1083 length:249 start_codon:yes stop_codon:yes gene_type:complete
VPDADTHQSFEAEKTNKILKPLTKAALAWLTLQSATCRLDQLDKEAGGRTDCDARCLRQNHISHAVDIGSKVHDKRQQGCLI